jgi:hypothetical protein
MKMKHMVAAAALASVAVVAACGGNAVVDSGGAGTTGAGGSLGVSNGSVGTGAVSPLFCGMDLPSVVDCGGTGSGGGSGCITSLCGIEQTWSASCQGDTCACTTQGGGGGEGPVMPVCNCTMPGGADACVTGTNCCFTTQ